MVIIIIIVGLRVVTNWSSKLFTSADAIIILFRGLHLVFDSESQLWSW